MSMKDLTPLKIRVLNAENSPLQIGCDTTLYTIPPCNVMDCTLYTTKEDLIDLKNQLIKMKSRGRNISIIINPKGFNDGNTTKHS